MTDLRKAAEQALGALESFCGRGYSALALSKRCDAAIKALRQALAQPERQHYMTFSGPTHVVCQCEKCKAQPKQEPVAYEVDADVINSQGQSEYRTFLAYRPDPAMTTGGRYEVTKVLEARPLYTAPPKREWVGLTDEEVGTLTVFDGLHHIATPLLADFIRAIEAKLKEKNT